MHTVQLAHCLGWHLGQPAPFGCALTCGQPSEPLMRDITNRVSEPHAIERGEGIAKQCEPCAVYVGSGSLFVHYNLMAVGLQAAGCDHPGNTSSDDANA